MTKQPLKNWLNELIHEDSDFSEEVRSRIVKKLQAMGKPFDRIDIESIKIQRLTRRQIEQRPGLREFIEQEFGPDWAKYLLPEDWVH